VQRTIKRRVKMTTLMTGFLEKAKEETTKNDKNQARLSAFQ
jgi:hypothetical protein